MNSPTLPDRPSGTPSLAPSCLLALISACYSKLHSNCKQTGKLCNQGAYRSQERPTSAQRTSDESADKKGDHAPNSGDQQVLDPRSRPGWSCVILVLMTPTAKRAAPARATAHKSEPPVSTAERETAQPKAQSQPGRARQTSPWLSLAPGVRR